MLCGIEITTGDLDGTADRQLSWAARSHGLDAGRLPGQRSGFRASRPRGAGCGRRAARRWRLHPCQCRQDARLAHHRRGLCRDPLQPPRSDQCRQCQGPGPGMVVQPRIHARHGGHACRCGRHHVRQRLMERGACHRHPYRPEDLDL
ncbi:hypothetical protein SDC9_159650 [bioreactor metagenome]|uniref:Uncharacterized protein n=1 Tax=bioreactor metagenome TaxID=1076179 RepID=A0A645FIR3_9ZZZZ